MSDVDGRNQRTKLLLVEDDPPTCMAIAELLTQHGYDVTCAGTLAEGLARLEGHSLLVLDVDLPDGPGTTILQKIRTDNLPVMIAVCSGTDDEQVLGEVRQANPDRLFRKPIDPSELIGWLNAETAR